jgi:predicted ATP-dependent protease
LTPREDRAKTPREDRAKAPRELPATDVGLPEFEFEPSPGVRAFDLSSHATAGTALQFGLDAPGNDYNVYVLGPNRSGRMTATREFVEAWAKPRPPAQDWIYVFDFEAPATPRPIALPAGTGRRIKAAVDELIPALAQELAGAFGSESYQRQVAGLRARGERDIQNRLSSLEAEANEARLSIINTPQGAVIAALGEDGNPQPINMLPPAERVALEERSRHLMEQMAAINREAARFQQQFFESLRDLNRGIAARATEGLLSGIAERFVQFHPLKEWLDALKRDVVEHYEMLLAPEGDVVAPRTDRAERRYSVNLLVDRSRETHPPVVCEHNPNYQNVFGFIEYRQLPGGGLDTDVTLIRAGALHRANGGVLILRAEALVRDPLLWVFLKGALRDGELRIEEFYRGNSPPIAGAPKPVPVPLDINVVIVGAPEWYYAFFAQDPEFQLYFKVKAEIEPTVDATPEDLGRIAGLIIANARQNGVEVSRSAVSRLLGMGARWAEHRERLTSRFELIYDVLIEASKMYPGVELTDEHVRAVVATRRLRNGQVEERVQRAIADGTILIQTEGATVGQINGLTVQALGDHTFGAPTRITARSSVGRRGVINIERLVAMSGPIQQKGSMTLQGILMRNFAHRFPLSFDCSVTFEQMYGGIEGDSASMAEYIAIVSELADVPLRQDLAITGSINQLGEAQVIGGLHYKIEGFYRACASHGALTGSQGVILPQQNEVNLVLRDEVRDAVTSGHFHLYSVSRVEEAIELFTGLPVGVRDGDGNFPADSVYGRVMATLTRFDATLTSRHI